MGLEVAGRGLHRRPLGTVDALQGHIVDALPALERRQLLLPGRQALGLSGHLLGIDRVCLHPGPRVGLVIAGSLKRVLLIVDLDLESLASPGLAGDRAQGIERARLLLDLEGGRVTLDRQRVARLLADQSVELGLESIDRGDVRVLARQQVLRLGQVGQSDRPQLLLETGLGEPQFGFHLGAPAEPSIDLHVAQLPVHLIVTPEPPRDSSQRQPDRDDQPTDHLGCDVGIGHAERPRRIGTGGEDQPEHDQGDRPARQRLPDLGRRDLERDFDLTRQGRRELADLLVHRAHPLDRVAQDRERVW